MPPVTRLQPEVTKGMSRLPWTAGLEAAYTFDSKYAGPVCMGVREGGSLWVPRETALIGKQDLRRRYPGGVFAIDCKFPPLDEDQANAIAKSVSLLQSGHNHIVEAPTGWGKSYVGAAIATRMRQPTLIVVTNENLIHGTGQWLDTLTKLIGVPHERIGMVQQRRCEYEGKWFVLGMVQSIVKEGKYPPAFFDYFGMVIFDEVHHMAADTFVIAARSFSAHYRLGLSATPERKDGKTQLFEAHIGRQMVKGTVVPMKPKIVVKKTRWEIPPTWTKDENDRWVMRKVIPAGDRMMKVYKLMAQDPDRNRIIMNFVLQAYAKGRTTVVLSDLIEAHLVPLFAVFTHAGIPGEHINYFIGGKGKHEANREMCRVPGLVRVVLGTYGEAAEGTNVPHWDTLVLATPHAGAKQPLGRILRKRPGKVQPVCLDLIDNEQVFYGYFGVRERDYYSVNAEIIKL